MSLRVLLVSEGSGGHLVPAVEVARELARRGCFVDLWFAQRPGTIALSSRLVSGLSRWESINLRTLRLHSAPGVLERFGEAATLWGATARELRGERPDVVAGFGGWASLPVLAAVKALGQASSRVKRVRTLLHEQNRVMGRANRRVARWVDGLAVTFNDTQDTPEGVDTVVTGLPVRPEFRRVSHNPMSQRTEGEERRVLVMGGSQGSRAINRLCSSMAEIMTEEDRARWSFTHVSGMADEHDVRRGYARCRIRARVMAFSEEMSSLFAEADLVISRAGASTLAELAQIGVPAVLIPYPYAYAHQAVNAAAASAAGGALVFAERDAAPAKVLSAVRSLLDDPQRLMMMGRQMRGLFLENAASRIADKIFQLAGVSDGEETDRFQSNAITGSQWIGAHDTTSTVNCFGEGAHGTR